MSTTPPPKKRRRIAGEAKPGRAADAGVSKTSKFGSATKKAAAKNPLVKASLKEDAADREKSPAGALPRAPKRTDGPKPPAGAAGQGLRSLSASAWALIALTVASLVFAASGIVGAVYHHRSEDAAVVRSDAADAASAAAEKIFSYRWNTLSKDLATGRTYMTPAFAKKYKSIAPALLKLAPQRRIQLKAVTRDAATLECGDACVESRARVLVFIDQARVADGSDQPTVFGNRMVMSMVKRNGKWLVANITAL